MTAVDHKRIARNTLLLYIRMAVIMVISLYTSRVALKVLGEMDYGLYGTIGGIVIAFSFLNGVLSAACNRYFAIEIGKGDYDALHRVFCLNVTAFLIIGVVVVLLSETVGLWFLKVKMVYPPERSVAVSWVYQLSIVTFVLSMLSTPYRAIVIAKEKMKVFAYSSIVEAVLKLLVLYLLLVSPFDKLIYYALLMLLVTGGVSLFYYVYCTHCYKECRYSLYWDSKLMKEIVGYTGWNVIGLASGIGKTWGVNLLLNLFIIPPVNAAYIVSSKVYSTINQFVTNFCTAFNPQITKSYSAGEHRSMMELVFQSSKFSYYLLFALVLPILIETPALLDAWLADVPAHAVSFTRLMLIAAVIDSISYPIVTAIQATGHVKWYQLFVGGTMLMTLPIVYIMLKWFHASAESAFIVIIICSIISQVLRVLFMRQQQNMDVKEYLKLVVLPSGIVTVFASIVPVLLHIVLPTGIARTLIVVAACFVLTAFIVYVVGITRAERQQINRYIHTIKSNLPLPWR